MVPHTSNTVTWPNGQYSNGTNGLLFYATGTGGTALDIASNGDIFPSNGFLFAPNGTILLEVNNGANGFWEAKDIEIKKNNFTMIGNGPGGTQTPFTTTTYTSTTNSTIGSTPASTSASVSNSTSTSPPTTSYTTNANTQTTAASTQVTTTGGRLPRIAGTRGNATQAG